MLKVKKNDRVKIIQGKDRGKTGKVLRIDNKNMRLFVEGINIVNKHTRQKGQNEPGGIIKKEGPIDLSNVKLVCPQCGKDTRVGIVVHDSGQKVRICKKCGEQI
ncbi:MAG: 50S ribosomal protein L24 [Candidatus Humimicrobiaceae bacterium]